MPPTTESFSCKAVGCSRTFNSPAGLSRHMRTHKQADPYLRGEFPCPREGCDRHETPYTSRPGLNDHLRRFPEHRSDANAAQPAPNTSSAAVPDTRERTRSPPQSPPTSPTLNRYSTPELEAAVEKRKRAYASQPSQPPCRRSSSQTAAVPASNPAQPSQLIHGSPHAPSIAPFRSPTIASTFVAQAHPAGVDRHGPASDSTLRASFGSVADTLPSITTQQSSMAQPLTSACVMCGTRNHNGWAQCSCYDSCLTCGTRKRNGLPGCSCFDKCVICGTAWQNGSAQCSCIKRLVEEYDQTTAMRRQAHGR
jgi:hypothetical protein